MLIFKKLLLMDSSNKSKYISRVRVFKLNSSFKFYHLRKSPLFLLLLLLVTTVGAQKPQIKFTSDL